MSKKAAHKIVGRWRSGAVHDAKESELITVLEAYGFSYRLGGKGHLVASHPRLASEFVSPALTINLHAGGKAGNAHPKGIHDLLKRLDFLEAKND